MTWPAISARPWLLAAPPLSASLSAARGIASPGDTLAVGARWDDDREAESGSVTFASASQPALATSNARHADAAAVALPLLLPGDQSRRRGFLSVALTGGTFTAAVTACLLVDLVYGLRTSETYGSNARRRSGRGGGSVGTALTILLSAGILFSTIAGAAAVTAITTGNFPRVGIKSRNVNRLILDTMPLAID